eukprot:TRINITY_DN1933_c1_g4_i1.p1 TRINITY_DN1933_c1_g4~~TRINITY_DN1933_c1_g4_i1.p1  ORF type:complete len:208 (-),score=28.91 TRINITY_DN1933_c1_g4_i1:236-859(-)
MWEMDARLAGTVLHVRNCPCKILEEDLTCVMRNVGLDVSRYEIYFPKKLGRQGRRNNFGYGFVTCSGSEDAEAFTRAMHGYRFEHINSSKHLVVEPRNCRSDPFLRAWNVDHPLALDLEQAATRASDGVEFNKMETSHTGVPISRGQDHERDSSNAGGCIGSMSAGPVAHEVPPTRLLADEASLANLAGQWSNAMIHESMPVVFRYQ